MRSGPSEGAALVGHAQFGPYSASPGLGCARKFFIDVLFCVFEASGDRIPTNVDLRGLTQLWQTARL
jgi:hypothetical protein